MSDKSSMHDSQPDYSKAFQAYGSLKKLGFKAEADEALATLNAKYHNNVPPAEMEHSLEAILAGHESKSHEKPQTHSDNNSALLSPRMKSGLGLAAVLTGISFLSSLSGMPYLPPPLY